MLKKVGTNVKRVCNKLLNFSKNNKSQNQIIGDDYEEGRPVLHFKSDGMQLQIDGNWVSKSIIESLFVKKYEEKLLKVCGQKELYKLDHIITKEISEEMQVLWTGCYSEVFKVKDFNGEEFVYKISLINRKNKDGIIVQNISSILSDVINTKRLSDLKSIPRESAMNYCENFANVTNLYNVWSHKLLFNKSETKELNVVRKRYEYLICEQTFAGKAFNTITAISPSKGLSLMSQLIVSLAIAEESMEFEHRDLHSSNVLIKETKDKFANYVINGKKFSVKLNGIKVTIIDTTFSRTRVIVATNTEEEYIVKTFYNDLSTLSLDDYPDDKLKSVYLSQQELTRNEWDKFCPKTNIIWLEYNIQQIIDKVQKYLIKANLNDYNILKSWKSNIGSYDSAKSFAERVQLFHH